jgi:hypothetical protein
MVTVDQGTYKTVKLNNRPWRGRVLGVLGERIYSVRDIHSDRGQGRHVKEDHMRKEVSFETTPMQDGSRLERRATRQVVQLLNCKDKELARVHAASETSIRKHNRKLQVVESESARKAQELMTEVDLEGKKRIRLEQQVKSISVEIAQEKEAATERQKQLHVLQARNSFMEKKLERVASVASVVDLEGKRIIRLEGQVTALQQKKHISDQRVKASEKNVKVGQCFVISFRTYPTLICVPLLSQGCIKQIQKQMQKK